MFVRLIPSLAAAALLSACTPSQPAQSPAPAPSAPTPTDVPEVIQPLREQPTAASEPDENPYPAPAPAPGHHLLAIDPQQAPYAPSVPESAIPKGQDPVAELRVCVSEQGSVASVEILRPSVPAVDTQLRSVVPRWQYRPYQVAGRPTSFCYELSYRAREAVSSGKNASQAAAGEVGAQQSRR